MKLRTAILNWTLVVFAMLGQQAQSGCYEKFAFDQIRLQARSALTKGVTLSDTQRVKLDRSLRQLTLSPLRQRLEESGLQMHEPFLNDLFAELTELQRAGQMRSTSISFATLEKANQIFEELCQADANIDSQAKGQESKLIFEGIENILNNDAVSGNKADIRSYVDLSLVFFILLGLISAIVFCWKSYVLAFPFLMNRKTCKIPATLRVMNLDIAGHIMILGKYGLRFVASYEDQQEAMVGLLKTLTVLPKTAVIVHGETFNVKLHVVLPTHCINHFETPIDRKTLNRLFTYSAQEPRFVGKTQFQSNLNSINPKLA